MILGVIPARAGSKGIENKNIYPLCGKPLIEYTIEVVSNSNLDDYIISTNCNKILEAYEKTMIRPNCLCNDDTPMLPVIQHVVATHEKECNKTVEAVMILQPTSPLRTAKDINNSIELFNNSNKLSLYSGYYMGIKQKHKAYDKHTQAPHFQRNGAIFMTKRCLLDSGKLWSNDAIEFEMPTYRSIDIDTMEDMRHAELLIKGGVLNA